jgi:hypothetical protein
MRRASQGPNAGAARHSPCPTRGGTLGGCDTTPPHREEPPLLTQRRSPGREFPLAGGRIANATTTTKTAALSGMGPPASGQVSIAIAPAATAQANTAPLGPVTAVTREMINPATADAASTAAATESPQCEWPSLANTGTATPKQMSNASTHANTVHAFTPITTRRRIRNRPVSQTYTTTSMTPTPTTSRENRQHARTVVNP